MTGDDGRCRPRLVDAGFPDRTPLVLAREAGLWELHLARVQRAVAAPTGDMLSTGGEPIAPAPTISTAPPDDVAGALTIEQLDAVLSAADPVDGPAAAFLAGRCDVDDTDAERLSARLRAICTGYDVTTTSERSLLVTECALSLALLGDADSATTVLTPMVDLDGPRSTTDWLAAYYLAQLGDVSGYPLLVRLLDHDLAHYRVLAARQLAGFLPHDGERVGGEVIDVLGRLAELLDDGDADVGVEMPSLVAEAGGESARPVLEHAAKKANRRETRKAAKWVLERLADQPGPPAI